MADLGSHAGTVSMAADYEFFSRPEWAALQKAYGRAFRAHRQMQPDFMYAAAASGEVDVIAGYTSDGLIAKYDLVVLDDPKHAIPPYDAIFLLAPKGASAPASRRALPPLLGRLDTPAMREANSRACGGDGGYAWARGVMSSAAGVYTLALPPNGPGVGVSRFKKLRFDPLRDFEPISSLGVLDFVFATGAGSEFQTLAEFIAGAKARPGALN